MKTIKQINVLWILVILIWSLSGCTSIDITGFAVGENSEQEEKIKPPSEENTERKEIKPTKEILDVVGAKKAEEEKIAAENEKSNLEEKKDVLKKELEQIDQAIEVKAEEIAKKEVEEVSKRLGESEGRKTKKKKAKERLERLKEKQDEGIDDRTKVIIKDLQKEQELIKELEELGESVITPQITLTSGVANKMITEAKELIKSKVDKQKAINNLNRVMDHATPSLKVKAGLQIVKLKSEEIKKQKRPKEIQELRKITQKVVDIAEKDVRISLEGALEAQMDVAVTLTDASSLKATAERIKEINSMNIKALENEVIAKEILGKDSSKDLLNLISNAKKVLMVTDKSVPVNLQLVEAIELKGTGKMKDLKKAEESLSDAISSIREKEMNNLEVTNILEERGILNQFARGLEIYSTDQGIKMKDIKTGNNIANQKNIYEIIKKMDVPSKATVYAHNPEEYINAITYDTNGFYGIDGGFYSVKDGLVEKYVFAGENEVILGSRAENIKGAIFGRIIESGRDLPLPKKLLPEQLISDKAALEKVMDMINKFFFNQIHADRKVIFGKDRSVGKLRMIFGEGAPP